MNRLFESPDESALDAAAAADALSREQELRQLEEQCPEAMEYVNQLIARMNTPSSSAPTVSDSAAANPPVRSAPRPNPAADRPAAVASTPSAATPVTLPPNRATQREEFAAENNATARRPPRATEFSTDLRRLREAANLTATSALQAYDVESKVRRAFSELMMAVSCMATSLVLVKLSHQTVSIAYGCAVLTLLQAAFATWRYFKATEALTRDQGDSPAVSLEDV